MLLLSHAKYQMAKNSADHRRQKTATNFRIAESVYDGKGKIKLRNNEQKTENKEREAYEKIKADSQI